MSILKKYSKKHYALSVNCENTPLNKLTLSAERLCAVLS